MSNINDHFFDGHYKEIWKTLIPAELTVKEVDFMVPHFNLQPGSRVLDLMCGYGRHALALGRKGIAVTAVDNLSAYVDEVRQTAAAEQLPIDAVCAPVIGFQPEGLFDLAICMGNSLNFFNREETVQLLTQVADSLKPGGEMLINSWSIAEIVFSKKQFNSWEQFGSLLFLSDARMEFSPARLEFDSITIGPDGKQEQKNGVDYIYSLNEMEAMLREAGFGLKEVYSIPGRKKFTLGEPRAYLVAQKA
jgi:SAM-dependent methyltransferase